MQHGVGIVEKAEQHGGESHRLGCRDMTAAFGFVGAAGVLFGFGPGLLLVNLSGKPGGFCRAADPADIRTGGAHAAARTPLPASPPAGRSAASLPRSERARA